MRRTVLIGDVHGCADELSDLLALVGLAAEDQIVLVGDLVGRGPDARRTLELARTLGMEIEHSMTKTLNTTSRGVKPAGFEVLRWTACPAVLVEMGFLTNDSDRAKLADDAYHARIAKAIAEAVMNYANLGPVKTAGRN